MNHGILILAAILSLSWLSPSSAWAVKPRPVAKHPPGTKVVFARHVDTVRGKNKSYDVPRSAADMIIEFANQIEMHPRAVSVLARPRPLIGSFTIGGKTWLHLLRLGILEDPACQGVRAPALKRLADAIGENHDNFSDQVFLQWADQEAALKETESSR